MAKPVFESLSQRLQSVFDNLGKGGRVSEQDVSNAMREVRMALLEADVALPIVKDFVNRVREQALGAEVHKSLRPSQQVIKIVHTALIETLGEPGRLDLAGQKPAVIMMVGLQGSGKTTTCAKLALNLRKEGKQPYLIAADTYRPAAVEQLMTLGKQIGVEVYQEGTSAKPQDIVQRGLEAARKANASVVIVDTAGRLQIDDNLMNELDQIKARTKPNEILLVADAMTGQEAVNIATGFNQRLSISGLVLTKVDGDARGGAALSMRAVTGVPIKYIGTGEKISADALEPFHPERIADRILGMGDVLTLIEKAEQLYEEDEAIKLQQKMMENKFTLQDFLDQLKKIRRMGPISQLMGMIPGFSKMQLQGKIDNQEVEGRIRKVEAIISSMTRQERENPRILRDTLAHYTASGDMNAMQGLDRIVREQAFTVLNRLAALRMAEARGLLVESVGNGFQSKGFQLYARLAGTALGETGDAYRVYLFSVFDELAQDLPGLFDRYSPQGRLFPREAALLQVLNLINDADIAPLWREDETIGWIYQYFNSKEERKAMREASQAPRNSRELAVRNQFFTPRYVVEFLVDNTLGRLWFNATGGQTCLRERCSYLLVKPDEAPPAATKLRDPRTLKLLDPACGSMHFGRLRSEGQREHLYLHGEYLCAGR